MVQPLHCYPGFRWAEKQTEYQEQKRVETGVGDHCLVTEYAYRIANQGQIHQDVFYISCPSRISFTSYGQVKYEDIDEPTKIMRYQNGEGYTILFTKPTEYSYQKEFRIVVTKPNEQMKDHIIEIGIDIGSCRFGSFDYVDLCPKNSLEETTTEG